MSLIDWTSGVYTSILFFETRKVLILPKENRIMMYLKYSSSSIHHFTPFRTHFSDLEYPSHTTLDTIFLPNYPILPPLFHLSLPLPPPQTPPLSALPAFNKIPIQLTFPHHQNAVLKILLFLVSINVYANPYPILARLYENPNLLIVWMGSPACCARIWDY